MGVIINFHEVNDPVWFENTVNYLKRKYDPVQLPELISLFNNGSSLDRVCHIMVDDGDRSFYNVIYPILKKNKLPATIFVSPYAAANRVNFWFQEIVGYDKEKLLKIISEVADINVKSLVKYSLIYIFKCLTIDIILEIINRYQKVYMPDKKPCQNMSVNELMEIENSGLVTIGAHTLRHPILANEELTISKKEIESSITDLADILGHAIHYFAYPNGIPGLDFGQREMDILTNSGCTHSFSNESGNLNYSSSLLSIPRFSLTCMESLSYMKIKLSFGSKWNTIMTLKPGSEINNRKALKKLIEK
jgi:peptidoglycan/xylan/chitin deacetylase (PgdA/CDA1 family)